MKNKKLKFEIFQELKEHIPFTLTATIFSVIIMSFFLIKQNFISHAVSMFYFFHPLHILFSSLVSSAIFYNYTKKIFPAIITGAFISLFIGSLSDVFFPYLGSLLFRIPISFHLPAFENPYLILGVSIFGASIGTIIQKTKLPHFIHVFISVFASLLYIFAYSTNFSALTIFFIFIITSVSVIVPCCLSDIVFPIIFQNKLRSKK